MATGADERSVFAHLITDPPAPVEAAPKAAIQPALEMLKWLRRWDKPIVSAKNLYQFGPEKLRDKKNALKAAEILERSGWLTPIKQKRHDSRKWRITQGFDLNPFRRAAPPFLGCSCSRKVGSTAR